MAGRRRIPSLLLLAALVLAAALAAGGCGASDSSKSVFEGEPVELGDLSYNVLFSRYLNPNDEEDKGYLVGQPQLGKDDLYLGLFLQIENTSKDASAKLPQKLSIRDTEGNVYDSVPSKSPFALDLGGSIPPEDQAPPLDSAPQTGPIAGSLVLFKLPTTAVESRPLSLTIPGQDGPAEVELDL
ncbi:MAG TPA: hypothetical protein VF030_07615 [Solirubrobacterales bacterium]